MANSMTLWNSSELVENHRGKVSVYRWHANRINNSLEPMTALVAFKALSLECIIVLSRKLKKKKSLKYMTFTVNIYKTMEVALCEYILQICLIVFYLEI